MQLPSMHAASTNTESSSVKPAHMLELFSIQEEKQCILVLLKLTIADSLHAMKEFKHKQSNQWVYRISERLCTYLHTYSETERASQCFLK